MKLNVVVMVLVAGVMTGFSAPLMAAKTTAEKVKKETTEAVDAAGVYANEKKEEFAARMKGNLEELDRQIETLKESSRSKSNEVKGEVRVETKKKIEQLEAKRKAVNERYESLEKSTGKAWTKLKAGVEKAVDEVRSAYSDAKSELESKK